MPTFIARRILAGSAARLAEYQMHIGFIRIGLAAAAATAAYYFRQTGKNVCVIRTFWPERLAVQIICFYCVFLLDV